MGIGCSGRPFSKVTCGIHICNTSDRRYFGRPKPWENDLVQAGWCKRSGVLGMLIKVTIWVNDQSV